MAYKTVLDLPLKYFDNVAYIVILKKIHVLYVL